MVSVDYHLQINSTDYNYVYVNSRSQQIRHNDSYFILFMDVVRLSVIRHKSLERGEMIFPLKSAGCNFEIGDLIVEGETRVGTLASRLPTTHHL